MTDREILDDVTLLLRKARDALFAVQGNRPPQAHSPQDDTMKGSEPNG